MAVRIGGVVLLFVVAVAGGVGMVSTTGGALVVSIVVGYGAAWAFGYLAARLCADWFLRR